MRRTLFSLLGVSLVAGSAGLVAADVPTPTPVQNVAQPRLFAPRGSSRPAVRRYRSYSIDPGAASVPEAFEAAPSTVRQAPAASRPSKPSYMRADAKARGQFGR